MLGKTTALTWVLLALTLASGVVLGIAIGGHDVGGWWLPAVLVTPVLSVVNLVRSLRDRGDAPRPDGRLMQWWERLPGPSKDPADYR